MSSIIGSAAVIRWIQAAGTTILSGDYRTFTYTPSIELLDETAGADTNRQRVSYMKDGQAAMTALMQSGSGAGGTAMAAALVEGAVGTLEWNLEGTAAGKVKNYIPAISMGCPVTMPYNNFIELSPTWQQNGTRSEGTN